MNNVLKKVSALFLIILMIFSISSNLITYGLTISVGDDIQVKEDEATSAKANNVTTSIYDLMITNRNNHNQAYAANKVAKNVNTGASADYDVLLTQDQSGQYYYCMEKGAPLMLYANGGATLREFYYKQSIYTKLNIEQKLVLAYLSSEKVSKIDGIDLNTNNNREKIIQYYVWKSSVNIGNRVSAPSAYANIISTLLNSKSNIIKIGNDEINVKDKTLTISGEVYEVKDFTAYKYTSQLIYRRNNGKGYIESNYNGCGQEMFSFKCELTPNQPGTPEIRLRKVDEEGNGLKGAIFMVYDRKTGEESIYETLEDGYTEKIPLEKNNQYGIKEETAPSGYEIVKDYVVVTVSEDGKVSYKIYDQNENEDEDTIYWSEDEISSEVDLILTLLNEKEKTPDIPKIKLHKVDELGNGLKDTVFTIYEKESEEESIYETLEDGYTEVIPLENGKQYIIKEANAPDGYKLVTDYVVVTVSANGEVTYTVNKETGNGEADTTAYWTVDEISGDISLILTLLNKKEQTPGLKQYYPLLMYIKGTVFLDGIEGKESITDGYYNPENNTDTGLKGIRVDIYDEQTKQLAVMATRETLTPTDSNIECDLSHVDWNALDKYGKSTVYTDENGFFEFYGLNPAHTYNIVFTYNGMRYAEIKATTETGIDASTYNISLENASKATELDRKSKIIDIFSEIGTYPYNYYSTSKNGYNIAYNNDDVEEAIQNGLSKCGNNYEILYNNLSNYMNESIAYFIKDCQVTAQISGLGNILSKAEDEVRKYNYSIKTNTGNFVYPVVEEHNTPNIDQVAFNKNYGYTIEKYYSDPITNVVNGQTVTVGYTAPYWHYAGTGSVGTLEYDERKDGEWANVKSYYTQQDQILMAQLQIVINQSNSETRYTQNITGNWSELKEGYTSEEKSGVQWAIFDTNNQQYLGLWYNKCASVTYKDEYNKLSENLKALNEDITTNLPCANLGLQYRSTFDLALYNDVMKADVTVNGVLGTYNYDKRSANGNAFSFGVNEYDLKNYYTNLTNGNVQVLRDLKYNNKISSTSEYMNYLRSTDIHYLSTPQVTNTGIAPAGGYDDNNNSIYLTYKIRIINQSSVKGTVTEIVDYYSNDFEVAKVYGDNNKEYEYSTTSIYDNRGTKVTNIDGFTTLYIRLDNTELENNESQYIYIVLKMKDIPNTLTSERLDAGYKTVNYAEINGYKTSNAYIDIDSIPGSLIGTSRFEKGIYEDDESISPTLIFKNPNKEGRTISGVLFEDSTTGEWCTTQTRQSTANNQFDETDTLIKGATVQLIQVLSDGTEKISAQTNTSENGDYKFINIRPGNYVIRFGYGNTDLTALTINNKIDDKGNTISSLNTKSYNGEAYENTEKLTNTTIGAEGYWYTDSDIDTNKRYSDAIDDAGRRKTVTDNFATLKNENSEILSAYKDSKVNRDLVNELENRAYMYATTEPMKLEMEYVGEKNPNTAGTTTTANPDGTYTYLYDITNVDFGIVERSRAKLDITKKVTYISLVDSTGKVITSGNYDDWQNGRIKYVKWILGEDGFVDMEIDKELVKGATLKITYAITVSDNSEYGNIISDIEVVDYVTNNLNYSKEYTDENNKSNLANGWETITTRDLIDNLYVNKTSANSKDALNKIDVDTYQTILKAKFKPGETKTITLEKNLSSDTEATLNYSNVVEIVSSKNTTGRGDYTSIYGNLDPVTYTSRQGNLYWDFVSGKTCSADNETRNITENSGFNPIRVAEGDSASAEEVIITKPEGTTGIVIPTITYALAIISLASVISGMVLIKKYLAIPQE